ncbi:MAG: BACON domain-containing protein [Prolixibacteraceae bacterium]|jgi:hypothetical protein|nr:BACON domain-containing protein [Prolixibacteraceae bacterium]
MKYIFSIVILFLSIVLLSCIEAIPDLDDNALAINTEWFEFDSLGGEQVLIIASNTAWEISYDSDWCEPSIKIDSGDVTLLIKAEPNDSFEVRTTTFSIKAEKCECN